MKEIEGVPHLDLTIADIDEGTQEIAQVLRPEWNKDDICIEDRSAGYVNKNYHCYIPGRHDAIFVRFVNTKMAPIMNNAVSIMRYLKRLHLGAQLLLTFTNGFVMEFVEGEAVTWESKNKIREPAVWLAFARQIATYHAMTDTKSAEELEIPSQNDKVLSWKGLVEGAIASGKIPEDALKGLPSSDEIYQWSQEIYQEMLNFGSEIKFCHPDSNPTNVIIKSDKSVEIIDYDGCCMDQPCIEIYSVFGFLGGIEFDVSNIPGDAEQDAFLREYLRTRSELEPGRGAVTEKMVQYWKFLMRRARLYFILIMIYITLFLQNVSDRSLDMRICHGCYEMYLESKDETLAETFSWDD